MIMNDRTYVTARMPGKWMQKFDKTGGSQGKVCHILQRSPERTYFYKKNCLLENYN